MSNPKRLASANALERIEGIHGCNPGYNTIRLKGADIMAAAKLNRKIIADNLRFMTITPSMDVDFTAGELSVSIFWHSPSINVAWYPIIQIDEGDKTIYHREGVDSMGPFCTAWSKFLFDAADFLEGVTA